MVLQWTKQHGSTCSSVQQKKVANILWFCWNKFLFCCRPADLESIPSQTYNMVLSTGTDSSYEDNMMSFLFKLVWTPCLMHRCVCIWRYVLQNYNYKLHFQNLFIYNIPHVSIRTLATENLDVCTACDPWDSNIQLTMGMDRRQQIYPNIVQLVSK